ncbi:hypothetical protein [Arthrobacter sp. zg-Y877]|uniref:hypothetical protein n=1 Tax=Arthrobacter sp. zg-Y877 TaxID=3049074 RepID=UPI0025A4331D|nr:hypothetical protein [Arthrobacter sp. zg-Y877]MDM7991224.1 hypothetical protein [Arthrobacter sp. zg-Y877]
MVSMLTFVSRRTAWLVLAGCTAFWVVLIAGLLEAPLGTPPTLMFLWMYASLMVALASTLVAAAAVAALLLHRRAPAAGKPQPPAPTDPGPQQPAEPNGPRDLYLLLRGQFKEQ